LFVLFFLLSITVMLVSIIIVTVIFCIYSSNICFNYDNCWKKNKTTSNDPQNITQKMEEEEPTERYGRSMVLQKDTGVNVDTSQQLKKMLATTMLFYCCNFSWGLRNNNHSPYLLQFLTVNILLCYIFIPTCEFWYVSPPF
jgi:hypothetical protein